MIVVGQTRLCVRVYLACAAESCRMSLGRSVVESRNGPLHDYTTETYYWILQQKTLLRVHVAAHCNVPATVVFNPLMFLLVVDVEI